MVVPSWNVFLSLAQNIVHSANSRQVATDERLGAPQLDELSFLLSIAISDGSLRTLWIVNRSISHRDDDVKLCGRLRAIKYEYWFKLTTVQ